MGDWADNLIILLDDLPALIRLNKSVQDAHWKVLTMAVIKKMITGTAEIDIAPITKMKIAGI